MLNSRRRGGRRSRGGCPVAGFAMPAKIFQAAGKQLWPGQAKPSQARPGQARPVGCIWNCQRSGCRTVHPRPVAAPTWQQPLQRWDCVIIVVATQIAGAFICSQSCLATTTTNNNRITINYITKIFTNWQRAQRCQWKKEWEREEKGEERRKKLDL